MRRRLRPESSPQLSFPGFAEVEEIGSGAFAAVYRARELDTNRLVALKVLRLADTRAPALETFRQETLAHGSVSSHPHILTLYRSFALPDGRPVLVLELCDASLAQRVRSEGPLSPEAAVAVGIKIGGALETAHRAGLLHRDVKPQNVLVTTYGEPVLADFGIAQLQAASQGTEGVFGFTTLHAPPEVLEGRPVGPSTDVYELASTLYQLITGRAAFAAYDGEAPASVILRILRDPVAPLVRADVPLSLSDALVRALAKDPADRPTSALALVELLQAVQREAGWAPTTAAVLGDPAASAPAGPTVPRAAADPPPPPPPAPSPRPEPPSPSPEASPPPPPPAPAVPSPPAAPPRAEPDEGQALPAASDPGRVVPPRSDRAVVDPARPAPDPGLRPPPPPTPAPTPTSPTPPDPATVRRGPEFVMPAESTSRPAVDNPYEGTIPALGASGSFSRPAGSAESDRGRPAWLVPVAAAVALVLLALVVLLLS